MPPQAHDSPQSTQRKVEFFFSLGALTEEKSPAKRVSLEATNGAYRLSTKDNSDVVIRHPSHFHKRSTDYLFDPRVHYDRFSKRLSQ